MNDHTFCRLSLKIFMEEVRKHTTAQERKAAWVWRDGFRCAEFHGPDRFYWYGSVHCVYDARIKGWEAYLRSKGIEDFQIGDAEEVKK